MSVNKVILLGYVGKDPEVKYIDANQAVARVSLATTIRAYKLANGVEVPEQTEWHNLLFWKGMAQTVEKYVRKGDRLYVEGRIRTNKYEDKRGITRSFTEIEVHQMEMLGRPAKQKEGEA